MHKIPDGYTMIIYRTSPLVKIIYNHISEEVEIDGEIVKIIPTYRNKIEYERDIEKRLKEGAYR
jgi:hypothetical protein